MDLNTRKSADKYPLRIFRFLSFSITNLPYTEGRSAWGLKTLDSCPKTSLWKDTLAFSDELSDSPVYVMSSNFNIVGGFEPLRISGQTGLGLNWP